MLAQAYCMTIVILAIGEGIRLLIVDGEALFWFGAFSLPHVLCLLAIIYLRGSTTGSEDDRPPSTAIA